MIKRVSVDDHSTQYSTRVDGLDFWNEHCHLRLVCEPTDKLACTKLPSTKLQVPSTNMPLIVLMCKLEEQDILGGDYSG